MLKNLLGCLLCLVLLGGAYECGCWIYVLLKLVGKLEELSGGGNQWMVFPALVLFTVAAGWVTIMVCLIRKGGSAKSVNSSHPAVPIAVLESADFAGVKVHAVVG
jgi:uncharacterized membrane protein